ncbi:O-antigen ligase family protein [Aerococcus urinaeequi]|uniref:O-antigen ligase family protein n=1 Tax=Aerococcus urinaeequi TaxID=51665 RepID=UPI003B3AD8A4
MGLLELIYLVGISISIFQVGNYWTASAIVLILGIIVLICECLLNKKIPKRIFNSYLIFLFLWFIWSLLSKLWVVDQELWSRNNYYMLIVVGYGLLTAYLVYSDKALRKVFTLFYLSTVIHVLIGFFEILTGIYFFTANYLNVGWYSSEGWPVSFFYNTNDFATYLLFAFIVILYFDFDSFKSTYFNQILKKFRPILLIFILLNVIATESRLILATLLLVMIIYGYLHIKPKYKWLIHIPTFSLIFSIVALGLTTFSSEIFNAITADSSGSSRTTLINSGLALLKESPLLGIGAGNFEYYSMNFIQFRSGQIFTMHNWWIENLTHYGIPFFLVYIFYYGKKLWESFRLAFKSKSQVAMLCFTWLVAFIPGSIVSSNNFDDIWIWIVNSIIFSLLIKELKKNKEGVQEDASLLR